MHAPCLLARRNRGGWLTAARKASARYDRAGVNNKPPGEVTQLLLRWRAGEEAALAALLPLVYEELRSMARRHLRHERDSHTLQRTALVHEAFLRMVDQQQVDWESRTQFYGLASQMMRRILVDHARRRVGREARRWCASCRSRRCPAGGGRRVRAAGPGSRDRFRGSRRRPEAARSTGSAAGQARGAALLRRPQHQGDRRHHRCLARDGEARVGDSARMAAT